MKIAVVMMNLGGPDNEKAVKPFLFNLFYDKAIIRLPNPLRYLIAKLISSRREKTAIEIYNNIGGKSPILENTRNQADLLEKELNTENINNNYKTFIIMRYWKPFAKDTINEIKNYNPDKIILLPLYPQFSTTTTTSSFEDFTENFKESIEIKKICCYPNHELFIESHVNVLKKYLNEAISKHGLEKIRVLFSAHSLPEKIIKSGDSYKSQVELTTKLIIEKLQIANLDYINTYQSKVGPVKWIGPMTDDEIKNAGKDKKAIVIIPISFVSEHSETLVELDIEYNHLSKESGVIDYIRVPTLSNDADFIKCLSNIVKELIKSEKIMYPFEKICAKEFCGCINTN